MRSYDAKMKNQSNFTNTITAKSNLTSRQINVNLTLQFHFKTGIGLSHEVLNGSAYESLSHFVLSNGSSSTDPDSSSKLITVFGILIFSFRFAFISN